MSDHFQRLEAIAIQVGEAVVVTADTVEKLAVQVTAIAHQLHQQNRFNSRAINSLPSVKPCKP